MKRLLGNLLRFGLSFAIVGYLVTDVARNDPTTFEQLRTDPKQWELLFAAALCLFGALMLGWTRWCLLARVLGLRVRFRDAYRVGFFGYMLDFLALGTMGGDVAKAVLLGREHGRRWGESISSVVLDRVTGLFSLSVVASIAILSSDLAAFTPQMRTIAWLMLAGAAVAVVGVGLMFTPRFRTFVLAEVPRRIPRIGRKVGEMAEAMRSYDRRRAAVGAIFVLSLGVPCLNIFGFYFIASGLPGVAPSLHDHFVIIPPAMLSGVIPLPMEALGVFEYAVDYLYAHISGGYAASGRGLLVALTYRVLTITIILLGTPFYLSARREIRQALDEADREAGDTG